jgi:hypothetical protein
VSGELDLDDGDEPDEKKAKAKPRGRPSNDARSDDRRKTIADELDELGAWLSDPELSKAVKEGAPRIAKFLSAYAKKHSGVARLVDVAFSPTGPLAGLRAFGPSARIIGDKVGAWRERRVDEDVHQARGVDSDGYLVDADGQRILGENNQPIYAGLSGDA